MSYAGSTRVLLVVGTAGALLALAGCGGPAEEASAPTAASTTSQEAPSEAGPTPPEPTESESEPESESESTPAPSSPSEPAETAGVTVEVVIAGGQVTTASDRVEVVPGDPVSVTVETDTADELHVHGVDMTFALEPGSTDVEFQVPGDLAPGLYEVETHDSHLLLFSLVVA